MKKISFLFLFLTVFIGVFFIKIDGWDARADRGDSCVSSPCTAGSFSEGGICGEADFCCGMGSLPLIPNDDNTTICYCDADCASNDCSANNSVAGICNTTYTLNINKTGSGTVTSTSSPAQLPNIACGSTCSANYRSGTTVTLTAAPDLGYAFNLWTGCDSVTGNVCTVSMNEGKTITVTFNPILTLNKSSAAGGTVASSPNGISCGTSCSTTSANFNSGTTVNITATPAPSYAFNLWTGCDSVTGNVCTVSMNGAKTITARFISLAHISLNPTTLSFSAISGGTTPAGKTLTISNSGGSSLSWTGSTDKDWCHISETSGSIAAGSFRNITVTVDAPSNVGSFNCQITITSANADNSPQYNNVTYTVTDLRLDIAKTGSTGLGTVTSNPAGISCGPICSNTSANYPYNTIVVLTATPEAGSSFTGWSGACTNATGTCTVTMSTARSVIANFATTQPVLTVTKNPGIGGTVVSSPAGINCGTTCNNDTAAYTYNTSVTLTATAETADGYTFAGWSGACTNATGTCTVIMTSPQSVTANFTTGTHTLTLIKSPSAGGTVVSNLGDINCGTTCSSDQDTYASNSFVTLTATAATASGYTFTRWEECNNSSGTTCAMTMDTDKSVTAVFTYTSPPTACTDRSLQTPVLNPISPLPNTTFQITCPTNKNNNNCTLAYATDSAGPESKCTYIGNGTNTLFSCPRLTAGGYTARCVTVTTTDEFCCGSTTTKDYNVGTCINRNVQNPTLTPNPPQAGEDFIVTCRTNAVNDCTRAYLDGIECSFNSWSGTNANFICPGATIGAHTTECSTVTDPASQNCCTSNRTTSFNISSACDWQDGNCNAGTCTGQRQQICGPAGCSGGVCTVGARQCRNDNACIGCSDGTLNGQCSSTRPQYCDNGNLINNCDGQDNIVGTPDDCGCPSATPNCQTNGSCSSSIPTSTPTPTSSTPCPPGSTCFGNRIEASTIWEIIEKITNIFFIIVIATSTIMILFAAYNLITAMGDQNKLQLARKIFTYVFVGLIVAFGCKGIIFIINNALG